ncbi:phosphopantetheine-binding protein [Kitasatospora sp. NBC_01287]|uniref:phosphopantetheine-binding protein n=1 Tax=Kitasatospora sp. NBC_01287 TaxID=2903573 RepID=UPI002251E508|nr:phosphopantetheine-binding protein [Kitasatospora sp. NBC_01287]MCX4746051.1 phosphopantetheine-binding protein [Kitasatospora sp. NBC_01287]
MLDNATALTAVREQIIDLLAEAGIEHGEITGAEPLNAVGLSSLLLARLIIQLELDLGVDPFAEGDLVVSDVRTVGELAAAYVAASAAPVAA